MLRPFCLQLLLRAVRSKCIKGLLPTKHSLTQTVSWARGALYHASIFGLLIHLPIMALAGKTLGFPICQGNRYLGQQPSW